MKAPKDPVQHAIASLMSTPVGRRWLLKAGMTTAMLATIGCGDDDDEGFDRSGSGSGATVNRDLHFVLGPAATLADLRAVGNGQTVPLTPHTEQTRTDLQSQGTLWGKMDRSQLSHFAILSMPEDRGVPVTVYGTRNGKTVVVAQTFHAHEEDTRNVAAAAFAIQGHYGAVAGPPAKLAPLGLESSDIATEQEAVHASKLVTTTDTAIAITKLHPNIANRNAITATKSLLGQQPAVTALGDKIKQMHGAGQDFATHEKALNPDGSESQIKVGTTTTGFSTNVFDQSDPDFVAAHRAAISSGIKAVRNTGELGTVNDKPIADSSPDESTWHQSEGIVVTPKPHLASNQLGAGVEVHIENTGLLFGTYTAQNGQFSGNKVPLKIYNNYVRWVWVYVQYLKADGTNLSLSENPTGGDTRFAKSLGLLPQVFTVLGVPLWDTNTIDVELEFPAEAASARLLYCGLGSELVGGGWRQYFPADAYPDGTAPTAEVIAPSLLTAFVTLGLTAFALVTDMDIASAWGKLKVFLNGYTDFEELFLFVRRVEEITQKLIQAEAAAATVAAGAATYTGLTNSGVGGITNLWTIVKALGTVLPKIIFNPTGIAQSLELQVGEVVIEEIAESKVLESIPLLGQIYGALAAVGDVATLAEAIGETIASPWVIKNEVALTYPATVTVSRDPLHATFPVSARRWQLEFNIDGAVSNQPIVGDINGDGQIQSELDPIQVAAPFAGKTINWSFVLKTEEGHQVGTGVSGQLANDDLANPPAAVSITITEIPAVIDADTVFERKDTTTYNEEGDPTWSEAVTDSNTAPTGGIQEISGVTVATRLGVAGIVWKANDKYWLRGVPVAENGNSISLGTATKQGYARRPFLLFDSFVGEQDVGNHVLLEPDDTDPGYHVRKVTLDPATGDITWDPNVSHGDFSLPVSAAGLHSSGRVVAVHTDTGRLGNVLPVATPRPLLASYSAGPGTEIGLLQSPTAVAVTNAGTILVLEAGASQLAAFDMNGNPVRYFGTATPPNEFTLPLPGPRTYLDVAVDGAAQIYVLSFTGTGTQVADYRIDVFTPNGTPLVTNSLGTNVPHLAVDYWRSIFAANFTPLSQVDPALGVPEPSLSRFDPS